MSDDPFLLNPSHTAVLDGQGEALQTGVNRVNVWVGGLGALVFGLIVAGILLNVVRYAVTEVRFQANGAITQAEVVEHNVFIDPEDPDDIKDGRWWVVYRYEVDGNIYEREQDILPSVYLATDGQQEVAVRYVAGNPALSRVIESERLNIGGTVAALVGAAFFGLIAYAFGRLRWNALREPAILRREGQPVEGELLRIRASGSDPLRVTVLAGFDSPHTGERITVTGDGPRPDLSADDLPATSTPVVVWYASDELYQLL